MKTEPVQEGEGNIAKRIQDKRKRMEAHQRAVRERTTEARKVKALYQSASSNDLLADMLNKCQSFMDYHLKIAKDGVGAQKTGFKLEDGTEEVKNVFFTQEQRVSHLDKAAGIEEIMNYIQRQMIASEEIITPIQAKKPETVVDGEESDKAEA